MRSEEYAGTKLVDPLIDLLFNLCQDLCNEFMCALYHVSGSHGPKRLSVSGGVQDAFAPSVVRRRSEHDSLISLVQPSVQRINSCIDLTSFL
jgi:hypothetical protein